jgi:hypothetical protein
MRNKIMPNAMRYILISVALLLVAKFVFLPNNHGDVPSEIAQPSTNISGSDDIEKINDGPTLRVEDYIAAIEQEPFPLEESVVVYGGQEYLEVGSAISVSYFESKIYTASGEEKLVGEYVDANGTYHPLEADSIEVNHGEFIDVDSFVISDITDSPTGSVDRGPFIEVNSLDESLGEQIEVGNDISIGEFIPLPR